MTEQEKTESTGADRIRVSILLSQQDINRLHKMAAEQGILFTLALRRAITTQYFLVEEKAKGAKFLLKYPDNSSMEFVIKTGPEAPQEADYPGFILIKG